MEARATALFVVLVVLVAGAGATVWAEDRPRRQPHAEEFHRLVGGVGFGPTVDVSGCAFGFDPRLEGTCGRDTGPIPGGSCFCPRHAGSVFYIPPLAPPVTPAPAAGQ